MMRDDSLVCENSLSAYVSRIQAMRADTRLLFDGGGLRRILD